MNRPDSTDGSGRSVRSTTVGTISTTGAVIAATDWLPAPLNRNIAHTSALERVPSTGVHGGIAVFTAMTILRDPLWARALVQVWFGTGLGSAILNWWVPYSAGRYPGEIFPAVFNEEYAANLSVLPVLAGHPVVPDVQHTPIHVLVAASAGLVLGDWRTRHS